MIIHMLVSRGDFSENHTDLGVRWTFVLYTMPVLGCNMKPHPLHHNLGHVSSLNVSLTENASCLEYNSMFQGAVWVGFPNRLQS